MNAGAAADAADTLGSWLAITTERLADVARADAREDALADARIDAESLLRHVTGRNRAAFMARPEAPIDGDSLVALETLVRRRLAGAPLAYVIGSREFWSLDLEVGPAVLIPRPDSETLVELALDWLTGDSDSLVLEAGTGSGAVAIAIASECPNPIVATDLQAEALTVAVHNAERLLPPARMAFVRGDWLAAIGHGQVALLVSNPPYLAEDDPHLPALAAEPRTALVADGQGLGALERLVADGARAVRAGGRVLLEHGYTQGAAVRASFARHGYADIATHRDLAGHERVTGACRP